MLTEKKATEMKAAFFDIDGVLSVPRYMINGEIKPGGSYEWWKKYNEASRDTYAYCRAPKCIKEFTRKLKAQGTDCFILSRETLPEAQVNKGLFIDQNYPGIFDMSGSRIYTKTDDGKIDVIMQYCRLHNIWLSDAYLLEDTFETILKASTAGIDAHHISEFLV